MNRLKKIVAIAVAGVMMMGLSMTAFAASGISATEQKVLDKATSAKSGFTMTAAQSARFDDAVAQARNYLKGDSVDLTEEQVGTIISSIDDAVAAVKNVAPSGDITGLSAAQLKPLASTVASILQKGANAAGINVTVHANGTATFNSKDSGKTVASTAKTVKATGMSMNGTIAIMVMLVTALGGCAVVAKKKHLFVQ
ncbi:MAG: hypothetical protein RR446_11210 [Lachnospiraceae bacterium]